MWESVIQLNVYEQIKERETLARDRWEGDHELDPLHLLTDQTLGRVRSVETAPRPVKATRGRAYAPPLRAALREMKS